MRGQQPLEMHLQILFGAISEQGGIALLHARSILRHIRESKSQIAVRPRFLNREEGGWRINLAGFVGMAPYFRPECLPVRPTPTARTRHP